PSNPTNMAERATQGQTHRLRLHAHGQWSPGAEVPRDVHARGRRKGAGGRPRGLHLPPLPPSLRLVVHDACRASARALPASRPPGYQDDPSLRPPGPGAPSLPDGADIEVQYNVSTWR